MNTINDKPRVSFGVNFTPRAQEIIIKHTPQLKAEGRWINRDGVVQTYNPINVIERFTNHKKSHDLTLDIKEYNDSYGIFYSFTKGNETKKKLTSDDWYADIRTLVHSINLKSLKAKKAELKTKYVTLKKEALNLKELNKLSRRSELKARFADNTASLIPELGKKPEEILSIVMSAPARFTFQIVKNEKGRARLLVKSEKYPIYKEYEPFSQSYIDKKRQKPADLNSIVYEVINCNHRESIIHFENTTLKNAYRKMVTNEKNAQRLKDLLENSPNLAFEPNTINKISQSGDISSVQIAELKKLLTLKSTKNLMLVIDKQGYPRLVSKNENNPFYMYASKSMYESEGLATLLDKMKRKDTIKKAVVEEKAELTRHNALMSKIEQMNNLVNSDAFKERFVGDSAIILLKNAEDIDINHLSSLVKSPKLKDFTFKLQKSKRGESYIDFYAASKKYPQAGFVQINSGVTKYCIRHVEEKSLIEFEADTLKRVHNEVIETQNLMKHLQNVFAKANTDSIK